MDQVVLGLFADFGTGAGVGFEDFMLRLLVAFLVGQAIGWVYGWSHGTLSYSQNYVQSLVLLSMVVCVIMGVVGDSLARAFGLGAALAIVRFRTPVKDSRDTVFLFLAVAVGMAAGAGQLALAAGATIFVGAVALLLYRTSFGMRSRAEGLLRFRFEGGDDGRDAIQKVLRQHCRTFALTASRAAGEGAPEELVYDVDLRKAAAGSALVGDLVATGGVTGVSLLPQARTGEG